MPMTSWFKRVLVAALLAVPALGLTAAAEPGPARPGAARALPRLVDLGSTGCIPCKAMAPILDGLRAEYAGRMDVVFIDVWKDRPAAEAYGIHVIPTQIFLGADGKELARHEGFLDRAAILARWKALGVQF